MSPMNEVPYPRVYRWGTAKVREVRVNGVLIKEEHWQKKLPKGHYPSGTEVAPAHLTEGENAVRYRIKGDEGDSYGFVVVIRASVGRAREADTLKDSHLVLDRIVTV